MECRLAGETEVLGGTLPQRHFCPSQNPTWPDPGLNPGRRGGKPATNLLSYGAAKSDSYTAAVLDLLYITFLVRPPIIQYSANKEKIHRYISTKN
jgi:hypothetical protein